MTTIPQTILKISPRNPVNQIKSETFPNCKHKKAMKGTEKNGDSEWMAYLTIKFANL